ncbi:MAG: IF-2-associated domain-containing protein, partial [Burkholderiales bacterium]
MAETVLLEQLRAAGVNKSAAEDPLTEQDKAQLLDYLRRAHGVKESRSKITLTRRETTEIRKADATGKARTIQVEVRKKRVFVKRDLVAPAAEPVAEVKPAQPVIDAEQLAKREEEARKAAELIARQKEEAEKRAQRARAKKPAEEEAKPAAEEAKPVAPVAEAAPAPAPAAEAKTEGTLHIPKAEEKTEAEKKKGAKKKAAPATGWVEEGAKKRGIKVKGD